MDPYNTADAHRAAAALNASSSAAAPIAPVPALPPELPSARPAYAPRLGLVASVGIRIVRSDGTPAGLGRIVLLRSLLPNLIAAIPYAGLFFVLIDALFVFADDRRCLHDRFADTIVVDA